MLRTITTYLCAGMLLLGTYTNAQTISSNRMADWSKAGLTDSLPTYANVVNIMSHGAVANGSAPNDSAFIKAMAALGGNPGTIYFPAGEYLFNKKMDVNRDSVIIKGDGTSSRLVFDLSGSLENLININGSYGATYDVQNSINKFDKTIVINSATGLNIGDYIQIRDNDSSIISSNWAYGSAGQILKVSNISGATITVDHELRRNYDVSKNPEIQIVQARKGIGIECLYIERKDATTQQTNNIDFNKAAECWVTGIEGNKTNFAHVAASYSTRIFVSGCYFHHAHAYGGGGQAYGTLLQFTSGDCLIENNVFEHLRHSILVQSGANGNVCAYNYSTDPFWSEASLPSNSAGDIVCHGDYPYLNLFEGNIVQNIVVDDSHGINGPYNTFFRNRAELYGILMNFNPASDSQNFAGNEITNTGGVSLGLYYLNGNGHFEHGNNVKGTMMPSGTGTLPEKSLYLNTPPGYWNSMDTYPSIGTPHAYNTGTSTAERRFATSQKTDCTKNPVYNSISDHNIPHGVIVAPNPFADKFYLTTTKNAVEYRVYDVTGHLVLSGFATTKSTAIDGSRLSAGLYLLELYIAGQPVEVQKLVKY